jgi:hypothetical protein
LLMYYYVINYELRMICVSYETYRAFNFLGASPQTPRVGFAEVWGPRVFCEAEQRFSLPFLEKEEYFKS